ncbi:MAG: YciC family protein [Myxococcota bacterium]|jgi:hypothetical protein
MGDRFREAAALVRSEFSTIIVITMLFELPSLAVSQYMPGKSPWIMYVTFAVSLVMGLLSNAAVIWILSEHQRMREAGLLESIEAAIMFFPRLLIANILPAIFIAAGLLCFIIPGVVLMVRYSFINCLVILEGTRPADARERSAAYSAPVQREILAGMLAVLAASLIFFAVGFGLDGAAPGPKAAFSLVAAVVSALIGAWFQGYVLLYFRERSRKMAADRGSPAGGE